jgi:hypothetical protein
MMLHEIEAFTVQSPYCHRKDTSPMATLKVYPAYKIMSPLGVIKKGEEFIPCFQKPAVCAADELRPLRGKSTNLHIVGSDPENCLNPVCRYYDPLEYGEEILRDCAGLKLGGDTRELHREILRFVGTWGVLEDHRGMDMGVTGIDNGQSVTQFRFMMGEMIQSCIRLNAKREKDSLDDWLIVEGTNKLLEGVALQVAYGLDRGDRISSGFAPYYEYSSLKQAIGIILFTKITRGEPFAHCDRCGQLIFPRNSRKRWCNDSCRSAGRKRK